MIDEKYSILDITCSIPAIAHSIAISTRTPTAGYGQQSKYMPDYGGVLQTHESCLKSSGLQKGLPFDTNPSHLHVKTTYANQEYLKKIERVSAIDSLVVASYLDSHQSNQFSIIRAIGSYLWLDVINEEIDSSSETLPYYTSTNYAQIPTTNNIESIKYSPLLDDYLLVRSSPDLKVIRLNKSYSVKQCDDFPTLKCSSISEEKGFIISDSCLNPFNKSVLAVASNGAGDSQIKFYDLNSNPRVFQSTRWTSGLESLSLDGITTSLRGRIARTFLQVRPQKQGVEQIDNIPSHIVNLITTSCSHTTIVDPRGDKLAQILVDKNKIPSFYPTEVLIRTSFSQRNSYQWYSLSNIHIRVFDMRFPNCPMNQINHMMDSNNVKTLRLKVIPVVESNLELSCISSNNSVCFTSFNQAQQTDLINPSSIHFPYHESIVDSNVETEKIMASETYPHSTRDQYGRLFSLYHLSEKGHLIIKDFFKPRRHGMTNMNHTQAQNIVKKIEKLVFSSNKNFHNSNLSDRDVLDEERTLDIDYVNIFDVKEENRSFESKRAFERFEKMKNKLESL